MSERLELVLQYLKAAGPTAYKHPALGEAVELIDEAIRVAECRLKAMCSSDARQDELSVWAKRSTAPSRQCRSLRARPADTASRSQAIGSNSGYGTSICGAISCVVFTTGRHARILADRHRCVCDACVGYQNSLRGRSMADR